jgi:hypothetical protein
MRARGDGAMDVRAMRKGELEVTKGEAKRLASMLVDCLGL